MKQIFVPSHDEVFDVWGTAMCECGETKFIVYRLGIGWDAFHLDECVPYDGEMPVRVLSDPAPQFDLMAQLRKDAEAFVDHPVSRVHADEIYTAECDDCQTRFLCFPQKFRAPEQPTIEESEIVQKNSLSAFEIGQIVEETVGKRLTVQEIERFLDKLMGRQDSAPTVTPKSVRAGMDEFQSREFGPGAEGPGKF